MPGRLLDFKTQERYYTKIVERYLAFCSGAGDRDALLEHFASLSLAEPRKDDTAASTSVLTSPSAPLLPSPPGDATPSGNKDLSDVLMALRKLREGIVASKRSDAFAVQAYLFCIRLAVLVKQPEAYHPAILHLLRGIHAQQHRSQQVHALTSFELTEVTAYLVLDTACRRGDLAEAHALRTRYQLQDAKVDAALRALVHDNYVLFRRVRRGVDGHRARLMEFAEARMRRHTLKCVGRTYLSVDLRFLEAITDATWADLQQDGVGWELDGQKVIIRKVRAK